MYGMKSLAISSTGRDLEESEVSLPAGGTVQYWKLKRLWNIPLQKLIVFSDCDRTVMPINSKQYDLLTQDDISHHSSISGWRAQNVTFLVEKLLEIDGSWNRKSPLSLGRKVATGRLSYTSRWSHRCRHMKSTNLTYLAVKNHKRGPVHSICPSLWASCWERDLEWAIGKERGGSWLGEDGGRAYWERQLKFGGISGMS